MNVLLSGIVGSTAYGLATPDSDVDRLGIYAVDTVHLHGLASITETLVTTKPDVTQHEVAKFCRLALHGNPTVMELLWLPDDMIESATTLGEELLSIRSSFLSAKRIRDVYLGYAAQQFKQLEADSAHLHSSLVQEKVKKHARHMYRLLLQGFETWATGRVLVQLPDPMLVHSFGTRVSMGDLECARRTLKNFEEMFDTTRTALPDSPDKQTVETWLRKVRAYYFRPTSH